MTPIPIPLSENLLSAWYVLELLSPKKLPSVDDLKSFNQVYFDFDEDTKTPPWLDPETGPKGKERGVYWVVLLGLCDIDKTTKDLLKKFKDSHSDEKEYPTDNDEGAVVILTLDQEGILSEEGIFTAAFPWASGMVLSGNIRKLSSFHNSAEKLKKEIFEQLLEQDDEGEILPLSVDSFQETFSWLKKKLKLNDQCFSRSGLAIRIPHKFNQDNINEPFFLNNSFYLNDLARVLDAARKNEITESSALGRYLSGNTKGERVDVLKHDEIQKETLFPKNYPLARWPGRRIGVSDTEKGFRPALALMQQFGINRIGIDLKEEGVFSVNGPPGTGKTTLLRDLVASVVMQRAEAMVNFSKPSEAFKSKKTLTDGNTQNKIFVLNKSLRGHEVFVTSSNNSAVENISRELPQSNALANDLNHELEYFKDVATNIAKRANGRNKDTNDFNSVWGLAAAALGNSKNRNRFSESFWWDKEHGFSKILQSLETDDKSGTLARLSWEEAKDEFHRVKQSVKNDIRTLQHAADYIDKLNKLDEEKRSLKTTVSEVENMLVLKQDEFNEAEYILNNEQANERDIVRTIQMHNSTTPNNCRWVCKVLSVFSSSRNNPWNQWDYRFSELSAIHDRIRITLQKQRNKTGELKKEEGSLKRKIRNENKKLSLIEEEIRKGEKHTRKALEISGEHFADDEFWSMERNEIQKTNPWIDLVTQEKRDELFAAAWRVHEAFIFEAKDQIRSNLNVFFNKTFKGKAFKGETHELVAHLWATFCMIVPVVSSTFASIETMLKNLGPESIGWLCIDEAGQAVPSHSVGAIWRSKRVVVVGDPLQIPPVVSIPEQLMDKVCDYFDVDVNAWMAPKCSTQVLADRANPYGTTIKESSGDTWVGSPLLVHRRCDEPMFGIANEIAYQHLMVQGKPNADSSPEKTLGISCWYNTDPNGSDKWNPNDGVLLCEKLNQLKLSEVKGDKVFVIAPFRRVVQGLKEILLSNGDPLGLVKHNRVGTVHTVQGKEADIVFLVLGASNEDHGGARSWATQDPNLLNVALTRAKKHFYVIGNHDAWKSHGCARTVSSKLSLVC